MRGHLEGLATATVTPAPPLITRPQPIIAKWERGEESSYFKYKSSDQSESMDIDSSALFIPKDISLQSS